MERERWNEIDATLLKETRDKTGRLVGDDGDYDSDFQVHCMLK